MQVLPFYPEHSPVSIAPRVSAELPEPGLMTYLKAMGEMGLYHSPVSAVSRSVSLFKSHLDDSPLNPLLSTEEAQERFGLDGELIFDKPIRESAAQLLYDRKLNELHQDNIITRGGSGVGRIVAGFGVTMAATMLDPVNLASMFVPISKIKPIARTIAKAKTARGQRFIAGALEGAVGQAMVEPFILLPALQEQSNYGHLDSFANIGIGAALGGTLRVGFGEIADRIKKVSPATQDAAFAGAIADTMADQPITSPAKILEQDPAYTDLETRDAGLFDLVDANNASARAEAESELVTVLNKRIAQLHNKNIAQADAEFKIDKLANEEAEARQAVKIAQEQAQARPVGKVPKASSLLDPVETKSAIDAEVKQDLDVIARVEDAQPAQIGEEPITPIAKEANPVDAIAKEAGFEDAVELEEFMTDAGFDDVDFANVQPEDLSVLREITQELDIKSDRQVDIIYDAVRNTDCVIGGRLDG